MEPNAPKIALVTGAAQGLGWGSAQVLASRGYNIAIADIDKAAAQRAAKELESNTNVKAVGLHCDVSKKSDVDRLFKDVVNALGGLDVLVNNAGIVTATFFTDLPEEDFDAVIGVHLRGTFLCAQAAARLMMEQNKQTSGRGGAIINTSSICAAQASDDLVHYHAAKGGIESMTRSMAVALARQHIRVNAVAPGVIDTPMSRAAASQDATSRSKWLSRTPLGRLGEPEEIGRVVAFLASDDSSYVTGQTIYADGGLLALNFTMPATSDSEQE